MHRSLGVTLAMAFLLPLGASAQAHQHGDPGGGMMPSDSSRGGMMQMHEQMQQHMAQMQQHMHAMQQMMQMHDPQGRSGMSPESGLSMLLPDAGIDLGLTDAQKSTLLAILEKARADALGALTPEQREKLEAAPSPS